MSATTRKSTVLLEHHLKQLKLPTMLHEYATMASLCQEERADYQTFLLRLCERELADREKADAAHPSRRRTENQGR